MTNPVIFRQYDIRGNASNYVTPELAFKIGYCFTKMRINSSNNNICVGRDGRNSSSTLYAALVDGITQAGGDIINIGLVPTPLLYFADHQLKPTASIMITASHNPKDDNGFKLLANGKSFYGKQIQELYQDVVQTVIERANNTSQIIPETDLTEQYLEAITENLVFSSKLKIAWDPGNGAACNIIKKLQRKLPGKHIIINKEIDGNFPNHPPDPTKIENLVELIKIVKDGKCNIGIALDGDADRVSIVTNEGKLITGDQLTYLFAVDLLKNNSSETIIFDVKTSQVIFDKVRLLGGKPIMAKTGHVFIKEAIKQYSAILGGEMSGHIFFADKYFGYDDGIYAALRFIDLLSRHQTSVKLMLNNLPKTFATPEIRLYINEKQKFAAIDKIGKYLKLNNIEFNNLDGVRVTNQHGWWLMRASNTESALIIRYEADNLTNLEKIKSDLDILLNQLCGLSLPI